MNSLTAVRQFLKHFITTLALGASTFIHAGQDLIDVMGKTVFDAEESPRFIFNEKNRSDEDRIGSFLYRAINDPNKVRSQVTGSAILYGLDSVGLGDTIEEGIVFIKQNTRFNFGKCGNVRLKTQHINAKSCLPIEGTVELNSNYDLSTMKLEVKWVF